MKAHGANHVNVLLPLLENYLNQPAPPTEGACGPSTGRRRCVCPDDGSGRGVLRALPRGVVVHDRIRESVIIMVGELCAFLAPTDPRVPHIINKLMAALATPSEQVQAAVAACLPALVKCIKDGAFWFSVPTRSGTNALGR